MKGHSVQSILLATLAAVVLAAIQPFVFMFSMMLCVAPVVLAVLYAWGGVLPAAVFSVGTVGSLAALGASGGAVSPALAGLGALCALVAPGAAAVYLLEKRLPFFRRMLIAIGVQTAALLACAAVIYLGMKLDLVDMITGYLREMLMQQPEEVKLMFLEGCYRAGMLTEESIRELTTGIRLPSDIRDAIDQVMELSNYQLKQSLPGMLMGSGVLSGILMTYFPSLISVRRGAEPVVPHVPLYGWFMPTHLIGGVAVCLVSGVVLRLMGNQSAMAVMLVFSLLASYLCIIQGMAAITRRFREVGAGKGARIGLIGAALVFAPQFLEFAGIASALFGRKGAVSLWMRKRMEEMEKNREDDDE